ncbi:peptide/nickel transport system ATP-binding protein [Paucidesulfovibrio gracilis DSM 16080]|uniref:Peptide/nickel transport system ATP-binding protein n=1 Tax=Paucidesulfovibrio gracilis DSM 16080 TaxID=1121449 RepID=A0A1T4WUN4_9BACT|nr:ABC transporter ATP-binding protein [Paucidesulfovibrio gracilis]SKA80558.1 peptide/nickel transport system ATP-binding protein [Paucidesulfovibrio gracilis DSM 16080]
MADTILDIRGLTTRFATPRGVAKALDTVNLAVRQGDALAIVGESGCGKTVLALSILGLIPNPPGRVTGGNAFFQGRDLLQLSDAELQRVRGNKISMIFQEPMTALNPVFRIGRQIAEPLMLHQGMDEAQALERAAELLDQVGIPQAKTRIRAFPHELSGGMRQRVMIAMALACEPDLLFADEPTTALDVTIQAQIMRMLAEQREQTQASGVLISHDLALVAGYSNRVAVMYAGRIVEEATTKELYKTPLHPYTIGLFRSLPRANGHQDHPHRKLVPIPGAVPDIFNRPGGCPFHPRCDKSFTRCQKEKPPLVELDKGHRVRCWLHN